MKYFIGICIVVLLGVGAYFLFFTDVGTQWYQGLSQPQDDVLTDGSEDEVDDSQNEDEAEDDGLPEGVIGYSEDNREIRAYTFGEGDTHLVFVAGLHGGYSWNTTLLGYELIDYLDTPLSNIPEDLTVHVIPVANPDGIYTTFNTVGRFDIDTARALSEGERVAGRFNANTVDLNRNFDCNWSSEAVWRDVEVDAGSAPFSEAETVALRRYIENVNPSLVVAYFSASGDVVASSCGDAILPFTQSARDAYAEASGYTPQDTFTYYETTGDMTDWLAKNGVPAISVVLESADSIEWTQNRQGIDAILKLLANTNTQ